MLHEKEGDTDEKSSHGMDGLETRFGGADCPYFTSSIASLQIEIIWSLFTISWLATLASSQSA